MDIKSIINKYSCTFLDTSLENEFQSSEWERNRKKFLIKIFVAISIAVLGFFIALNVHNQNLQKTTYSNYNKWGAYWIMLTHTINASIYTLLIFANEIQKKKYGNNIFAITVALIILAVNVKSFTGTDLEYIPGNMIAYFWPAYPLTLSVLIIIIFVPTLINNFIEMKYRENTKPEFSKLLNGQAYNFLSGCRSFPHLWMR